MARTGAVVTSIAVERVDQMPAAIAAIKTTAIKGHSQRLDWRAGASLRSIFNSSSEDLGAFMKMHYSSRKAEAMGRRAARKAGKNPPATPMTAAHVMPFTNSAGVTSNANDTWLKL